MYLSPTVSDDVWGYVHANRLMCWNLVTSRSIYIYLYSNINFMNINHWSKFYLTKIWKRIDFVDLMKWIGIKGYKRSIETIVNHETRKNVGNKYFAPKFSIRFSIHTIWIIIISFHLFIYFIPSRLYSNKFHWLLWLININAKLIGARVCVWLCMTCVSFWRNILQYQYERDHQTRSIS